MLTDEYKTRFSLWAMIAAPLIAGNDLRKMSPDATAILLKGGNCNDQDPLGAGGIKSREMVKLTYGRNH